MRNRYVFRALYLILTLIGVAVYAQPAAAQSGSPGTTPPAYFSTKSDPVAIQTGNVWVPPAGADSYSDDRYERPFSTATSNNVYYSAVDISSYSVGYDNTWMYYRLQMVGSPLSFLYGFELNFRGGTRAQRGDMMVSVDAPNSNLTAGTWGKNAVFAYFDANTPGVGHNNPLQSEDGKSGSGYNTTLSIGDSVWARYSGSTLEIAVRRTWLTRLNDNVAPTSASFRGWAAKGNAMDRSKMMVHDHRTRQEANSPYPWLSTTRPSGVGNMCPNVFDTGISDAARNWLESGSPTNTGIANPCYPSGGIYESDNTGSAADLASQSELYFANINLGIAKSAAPSPVQQGQTLTYTLTVTNPASGSATATNVTVTDTLPASVSFVSASPSCTNTTVTVSSISRVLVICQIGTMATNTTSSVQILVTPNVTGSLSNTAHVRADQTDTNTADNLSTVVTTVTGLVDLTIGKVANSSPFQQGQNASYTITVTNAGNQASSGTVTVTDELPAGLTFVSGTGTGWSVNASGQTVTATHTGAIAASGTASFTLTVSVGAAAVPSVTNAATVSGGNDSNTDNNSSGDVVTPVTGLVDLTIAKVADSSPFQQGQNAVYTITVTNAGTAASTGTITVTDVLPAGLTFVSGVGTGWSVNASGQTVTATHTGAIAASGTASFTLTVAVGAAAVPTVTNVATVSGGNDSNTGNNSSGDVVTPVTGADLTISKLATGTFQQSASAGYSITVTNAGNQASAGTITVEDVLPSELTFVSGSGTGWTVGAVGQTVTATYTGSLAASATASFSFTVSVSSSATEVTNVATVSGGNDSNLANNSSNVTTSVMGRPSITLMKSVSGGATAKPGAVLNYSIVFLNAGNSQAVDVLITDMLPSQLTFQVGSVTTDLPVGVNAVVSYFGNGSWSYTPTSGGCGAESGYDACVTSVRWTLQQDLAPSAGGTVTLNARLR